MPKRLGAPHYPPPFLGKVPSLTASPRPPPQVLWGVAELELAVHDHVGEPEAVLAWGWPDERRSWTWPGHEGRPLRVRVYARCDAVRLVVNGAPVGPGPRTVSRGTRYTATYEVPYAAGQLQALGYRAGQVAAPAVRRAHLPPGPVSPALPLPEACVRGGRGGVWGLGLGGGG